MSNQEQKAEIAFDLERQIKLNESARRNFFAQNIKLLAEMKENKYYKLLMGDSSATWAGYLSDRDVFYTRNQVNSMMKVYRTFTEKLGLEISDYAHYPHSRLLDICPIVQKDNYEEWLSRAQTLTTRDWNIEVRSAKGLVTEVDEDHKHNYTDYKICKDCGAKHKAESVLEDVDNFNSQ